MCDVRRQAREGGGGGGERETAPREQLRFRIEVSKLEKWENGKMGKGGGGYGDLDFGMKTLGLDFDFDMKKLVPCAVVQIYD